MVHPGVRCAFVDDWQLKMHCFSTTHAPSPQAHRERAMTIRQELIDVILGENQCDVRLYKRMQELHDRQLLVLRTPAFEV